MLDLAVFNHTERPFTIELALFREGGSSRSAARAYDSAVDVEPHGETIVQDIAVARPYVVRYCVFEDNRRQTYEGHVHYYPTDGSDDDALVFDIHAPGVLTRR